MRQASLKLKNYYQTKVNFITDNDLEKKIFHVLLISFGFLSLCYLFIVGSMISNIIERKTLEVSAHNISNELSELETSYFSMSKEVDMTLSTSMGFKEVKANFATRKALGVLPQNSSSIKLAKNEI